MNRLARVGAVAALAYAAVLAVNRSLREVTGRSMLPALWPGDRVLTLPAWATTLERGSVVVVRDPRDPARETVKRVVGLPGETVVLAEGRLTVDGEPFDDPHAAATRSGRYRWVLGEEEFVVLGDNRAASTDSRDLGPLPRSAIAAVVWRRVPTFGQRRTPTSSSSGSSRATPSPP